MKMVKFLGQKELILVYDPLNQMILQKLVLSENSVAALSEKLNVPSLKLWRRLQKLLKANLIEVSRTEKVGNLEKKLYRATATRYVAQQPSEVKPKDSNLQTAFNIYADIQRQMTLRLSAFYEIPKNVDPVDYVIYATMEAFAEVFGDSSTQARIAQLKQILQPFNISPPNLQK